jgi:hypothetical protein
MNITIADDTVYEAYKILLSYSKRLFNAIDPRRSRKIAGIKYRTAQAPDNN